MYLGHGIIVGDAIIFFAEICSRLRYGAPQGSSLKKFRVNIYRKTPQID